jgi:membrane protein implicated in regulation of membrane protease activity
MVVLQVQKKKEDLESADNKEGCDAMQVFGTSNETIYLTTLIIAGILTLLFLFFGDVFEGAFEALPILIFSPTLILAFITFFSAGAYIFEALLPISSLFIIFLSIILSILLVILLNVFVLIPISAAEESLAYREEDLKGRVGRVITSIPIDGYGEVVLEGKGGTISKSAISFENQPIPYGTTILVIEIESGVLSVVPHEPFLK